MNSAVLRKVIKQNRFNIILICFILFQTIPASSHSYKKNIIIDTDMALDDTRALVMPLNQDINNIHLIVTSDGAVSPEVGYQNLKKLLANLNKKDIKIAIGRELHKKSPSWRAWSEEIFYSNSPEVSLKKLKMLPADTAIVNVLHSTDVPIVYLCLGPFTNLADALKMDSSIIYS